MSENNIDPEEIEKLKREQILVPLESAEQLRDWVYLFFDIYMPLGHVYPESNSSSVEAMWKIYCAIRDNTGDVTPGYTLLSSRDSYKTLSASILEVLLLIHFRTTIAHCSAILSQSQKSVEYCTSFMRKVMPYLTFHGWKQTSANKMRIELTTDKLETCYIQIIILTMRGANCILPNTILHLKDGSFRLAKDCSVGDKVLTWDFWKNEDIEVEVGKISHTNKSSREIIFEDGSNIVVSDDHMVFTKRGWIAAANLRTRDLCKGFADNYNPISTYSVTELNPISRDIDQLIMGTLLGDGYIHKLPSGKCRYSVFHCKKQKSYLDEIKKVLDLHNIESTIRPDRDGYKLLTKTNVIFEKYHEMFYVDKIKTPTNALPFLNYEGIAYWFMDDVRGNGREVGNDKDHCFELATCSFTLEEHEKIVQYFKNMGYNCSVAKIRNQIGTYNIVKFSLKSSREISSNISIYFVNDLRYKILPSIDISGSYRTVDEDELIHTDKSVCGFKWSSKKTQNSTLSRKMRKEIKPLINKKIKTIKTVGRQNLIDIEIKTETPYLRSFYANNCLVHNSAHTNLMFVDEVDLCDPAAYQESKLIPGVAKGVFPITVRLSTRKFAFGLMEKEMAAAASKGEEIIRWNILDVTEHCPASRCKPDKPMHIRYIPRELPLRQISKEEYLKLDDNLKNDWQQEKAYEGCLKCPLFSICKRILHEVTPKEAVGDLFKPIPAVINIIKSVDSDVAEAQLLCHKPSSKGLIYPRFSSSENILTVQQAWEKISGLDTECTLDMLIQYILDLGIEINAGVDWGYTNEFAVTVAAILPGQQSLIIDMFAASDLELDDCVEICKDLQQKYRITKFWCDQAYPAYIKTFNRNGLTSPKFIKDVPLGIESVRGRIVNSNNKRSLFLLKVDRLERLGKSFGTYHWKIDAQGNITDRPDHTEESDVMDSVRYLYQCIYGKKSKINFAVASGDKRSNSNDHNIRMTAKISELAINDAKKPKPKSKKRILFT